MIKKNNPRPSDLGWELLQLDSNQQPFEVLSALDPGRPGSVLAGNPSHGGRPRSVSVDADRSNRSPINRELILNTRARLRALSEITVGFLSAVGVYRLAPAGPAGLGPLLAVLGWLAAIWVAWKVLPRRAPDYLPLLDLLLLGTAFATLCGLITEALT